jgi:hypothetical protein
MPKKSMIEGSGSRNPKVYLFLLIVSAKFIVRSSPCELRLPLEACTPVALRKRFSQIPFDVGKNSKKANASTHNNLAGRNSFDCIVPKRTHSKTGSDSDSYADC